MLKLKSESSSRFIFRFVPLLIFTVIGMSSCMLPGQIPAQKSGCDSSLSPNGATVPCVVGNNNGGEPTATATPSGNATPTPAQQLIDVQITLPATSYDTSSLPASLTANTSGGVTIITGTWPKATQLSLSLTNPCYQTLTLTRSPIVDLVESPSMTAAKSFLVTLTSSSSGVTYSQASPFTMTCADTVTVRASKSGSPDVIKTVTVSGADTSVSFNWWDPSLVFTKLARKSDVYYEADTAARTVAYAVASGVSVDCSFDNETTWTTCGATGKMIYTAAQYNANTSVSMRMQKSGSDTLVYKYLPKTEEPGFSFVTCDETVSGNKTFTQFAAYVDASHQAKNICLSSGLLVQNAGSEGAIPINGDLITLVGPSDQNAIFSTMNGTSSANAIEVNGRQSKLSNLQFKVRSSRALQYAALTSLPNNPDILENIAYISSDGDGIGSADYRWIRIQDSTFSGYRPITTTTVATHTKFDLTRVTMNATSLYAIRLRSGTINVTDSSIASNSTTNSTVWISAGTLPIATGTFTRTTITSAASAITLGGVLTLDNCTIKKTTTASTTMMYVELTSATLNNTSGSPNLVCNMAGMSPGFTAYSNATYTGTFVPTQQTNGATIGTCP